MLNYEALRARHVDNEEMVNIAMPFNQGEYFIAQGGANRSLNEHFMTLDKTIPRFKAWLGQSKGIDIVLINKFGLRAQGLQPSDPAQYHAFGTPVLAPCKGIVETSVDGHPDMEVPQMDRQNMLGNHVIVNCKGFCSNGAFQKR